MNVVYYARVSTDEEKQLNALEKQIEELKGVADSHNDWLLVDEYVDEGKSGTTTNNRVQYNRLYEDLLTDKFDVVIIKDQSRLMRNVLDWYLFLDRLVKNNKKLYMYLDNCYYTPENSFLTGIKAMMAEEYSRELSKKISSSAKRSQKNGTVYGNNTMYGYNQADGKLTINEEQAELVRKVFSLYISGLGFRKISDKLDDDGIRSSTGTAFSLSTLKRMIKNEKYKGLLVSGKSHKDFETKKHIPVAKEEMVYIPNGCPAIVSEETWDLANKILKERTNKVTNRERYEKTYGNFQGNAYPLSSKIVCGQCGATYWHNTYTTAVNKLVRNQWLCGTYKAYGSKSAKGCDNIKIMDDVLMATIRKAIFEIVKDVDVFQETLDVLKKVIQSETNDADKIKEKIDKITQRKDVLLDSMLDGVIDKTTYIQKTEKMDKDIEQLNEKYEIESEKQENQLSKEERLNIIEQMLAIDCTSPEQISDDFIKEMVDKIVVYKDKLDIILSTGQNLYVTDMLTLRPHTDELDVNEISAEELIKRNMDNFKQIHAITMKYPMRINKKKYKIPTYTVNIGVIV